MPKMLLIQPSQYLGDGSLIKQRKLYLPGLVFPLLTAMAPPNWEFEAKIEIIEEIDFDSDVDIVGIGAMGHSIFRAFDIAREFRREVNPFLWEGTWLRWYQTLPYKMLTV